MSSTSLVSNSSLPLWIAVCIALSCLFASATSLLYLDSSWLARSALAALMISVRSTNMIAFRGGERKRMRRTGLTSVASFSGVRRQLYKYTVFAS